MYYSVTLSYRITEKIMQTNKLTLSDKLISSREVREKLQITRKTLCKYNQAGKLTPIKVSERKFLYDAIQIEQFLNKAKYGK
jgi:predicted DNA-binding transcriptional regulator AlpA